MRHLSLTLILLSLAGCAASEPHPADSPSPATMTSSTQPTTAPATEVKILYDLPYKSGDDLSAYERERCRLDLYLPEGKGFATVVWFYGGGLESGEKSRAWHTDIARTFARRGIACAVVDYRLSPQVTYPAYIDDAAASVAWVVQNIASHGGDPRRVFVSGHSAGAYLATLIGFDPQYLARYQVQTSQLAGLLPVSPQVFTHFTVRKERGVPDPEHTPVIDAAAPAYHARPDAPPILIIIADGDMPTRLEECQYFLAMLKTVKHPDADLLVVPNRNHGSVAKHIVNAGDPALQAMLNFIATHPAPAR